MKIFLQDTTRKTVFTVACATSFSLPAAAAQKQPNSEYGLLISALVHQNLASVLARRDPGSNAGPGQGAASCSFWIKPTAQVTRLKCSGSTPGQAAVLRQTIKATQFPPASRTWLRGGANGQIFLPIVAGRSTIRNATFVQLAIG